MLEPALPTLNVRSDKLFVRLSQVDNSFNDADDVCEAAGQHTKDQLNYSFRRITQNELVNAQPAKKNRTDTCGDLLICA